MNHKNKELIDNSKLLVLGEKHLSASYLLDCLVMHKADKVNMHYIGFDSGELAHFTSVKMHPIRNKYTSLSTLKKLVDISAHLNAASNIVISTTYKTGKTFKNFIGLDIEYMDEALVLKVCERMRKSLNRPLDLIKTTNGFHIFLPIDTYGSDLELWMALSNIIDITSSFLKHKWVQKYIKFIRTARNYDDIKMVSNLILKEIGHINSNDSRPFTFIDIRHLAQAALSNERKRGDFDSSDEYGVRTQPFFRISNKTEFDYPPYVIRRFS